MDRSAEEEIENVNKYLHNRSANEMEDKKFEVKYSGNAYNIFEFLNRHPGGINYITPCEKKEVTQRMHQTQHAKA
ncbi:unnamed protein product, partial [Tenebrio molitor]